MHGLFPRSSGSDTPTKTTSGERTHNEVEEQLIALEGLLQRDGWKTSTAVDLQPEFVVPANSARTGIAHEVARDQTAAVIETFQDGTVVSSCAYREQMNGEFREIVLLLNPGVERAILLPAVFDQSRMASYQSAVADTTDLYSIVTHPTEGRLGAVEHPSPDAFDPNSP